MQSTLLGREFLIFSACQWRSILSSAHSAQETFFKWPDSCQKELTSFPILKPDNIYDPSFKSAGVNHQPNQIRFIILPCTLWQELLSLMYEIRMKFNLSCSYRCSVAGIRAVPGCTPCAFRHYFPGWSQSSQLVSAEVAQGTDRDEVIAWALSQPHSKAIA